MTRAHRRTRALSTLSLPVLALVIALGAAACGGDDDQATGNGVGADTPTEGAACNPVGEELEADADTTVGIDLQEYAFVPASVEVEAGVVTFAAENVGEEDHELAFLPGGGEVPLTDDGEPDEDALAEAGAFELEAFGPDQTCNATYDLEPGTYTMFCIVTTAEGSTHYELGMRGELVVM